MAKRKDVKQPDGRQLSESERYLRVLKWKMDRLLRDSKAQYEGWLKAASGGTAPDVTVNKGGRDGQA